MDIHPPVRKERLSGPSFTRLTWALGFCAATLLFLFVWFFCDLCYANNDDTYILRMMMGYGSPELPTFNMCLHFVLLYPLRWLATAFPGVAWFSWMQLFFLWLSSMVLVKGLLQCFHKVIRPLWQGLLASLCFLIVFVFTYFSSVTFTVTAALLGAAAVVQILSIDPGKYSPRQVFGSLLLSLLLVVCAYGLRQITALPILAFCLVAALALWLEADRSHALLRPMAAGLLACVVVLGGLAGLRQVEIRQKGVQPYLDWQVESGRVIDYYNLYDLPQEVLQVSGWTASETALVADWYFMDESISVDAFRALDSAIQQMDGQSLSTKLQNGLDLIARFGQQEPLALRSVWLALGAWALCLLGLCLSRLRRLTAFLPLLLGAAGGACMLLYLSMQGRLPLRAVMMVVLPFAALVFGLLPACLPRPVPKGGAALLLALSLCWLAGLGLYAVPAVQAQLKPPVDPNDEVVNAYQDLDEFAVDNEDLLLIYDGTLAADLRMFPSTEYGIPKNLLFWGGWGTHSPEYNAQLTAYGFDPEHWSVENFLSENVRLMRGAVDPPPVRLMNALNDRASVDNYLDSQYGYVYSFVFYEQ